MEQDEASRRKRRGGKRKRRSADEETKTEAIDVDAEESKSPEPEEKAPAPWACPACTFLNEPSRCFCEMCETPNPTPPSSGAATAPDWTCAACTVVNPAAMRVCAVCGSLNPRPIGLSIGRLGAMEEFSDSDDSEEVAEDDAWVCRSCDMLATGNSCPQCLVERPKSDKKRRKKRRKEKRARMAYGVSIVALKKLMQEPTGSRLVDTLQTLTHTLAMMDASADNEWGDGPSFLMRSFGGGMPSAETSKDPELLTVLASIFGEKDRGYPIEVRLLALQSVNYLMKMDRHMFARSKLVEVVGLYIANLFAWKHKKVSGSVPGDEKSAQMVVEECLNGLSSMCCTEAFALRELLARSNFAKYLDFMLILADAVDGSAFHPSIIMTALSILQKCCMRLRWSARSHSVPSSKKSLAFSTSPKKKAQDGRLTLELATKLVKFLLHILQHKHVPSHVKAAKCLLLIFHRAPYDSPEVIAKLITAEVLRKFVDVVVNTSGEESEESRIATISLLLHLFDNRPQLVTLFVKESIYDEMFGGMLPLLQSSSTALRTNALKLTALLTRLVCKKSSLVSTRSGCPVKAVDAGTQSPCEAGNRQRLNSLPDPDVLSTLLLDFIRVDSIPAVSALLKDGADLNFPKLLDVEGNEIDKPLVVAAKYSSLGMVRFLVKRGADVHQVGPNGTALHVAAKAERCDVAAFLLQCGARAHAKDRKKKTVMDYLSCADSGSNTDAAPSPMKKFLELHQGTGGIRDYDSELSESDNESGRGSRGWFFPSDNEDEYDDDDDDMDDDEFDDYYMNCDDIGGNKFDRGQRDKGTESSEDDMGDSDDGVSNKLRKRRLGSTGSESETKSAEPIACGDVQIKEHVRRPTASASDISDDDISLRHLGFSATTDEIYGFSLSIITCLMAVLHDMDIQNVERSVLSTLACVLEMAPSQLIRSLKEGDVVLILDTVHFLLQEEKNHDVTATTTSSHTAPTIVQEVASKNRSGSSSNLPSFILALRILQAMLRKSSDKSSIFHQIERRGISEQIEQLNDASACWMNMNHDESDKSDPRGYRDTIFGRGLALLQTLRNDMLESGTLHLHKLKNLARRLKEFTASSSTCEKDLILVDLVELFEQPNSITTYEFKQSELLPAVLQYLCPDDELDGVRASALMRAFEQSPSALKNLLFRLQSIITQEETFPLVSLNCGKGRELYPLTRQLKISFMRFGERHGTDAENSNSGGRPKVKSIHSSPLTHFQSFERTVSRCMPAIDADLSVLYINLVGHTIQKVIEGKWRKFLVVGYDDIRSHHLVKPLGYTDDELTELVLHDSQCKLLGNVDVYENVTLDLQLFGFTEGGHSDSKKKRKNNKRKRKTTSPKPGNSEGGCLVEVRNDAKLGKAALPGAWYAAVLVDNVGNVRDFSSKHEACDDIIASQKLHSVKLVCDNRVVHKIPTVSIRARPLNPQVGSVVEVDGALGEVTRVYSNDRSSKSAAIAAHQLMDVKISSEVEKSRVKKEQVHFPPRQNGTSKFNGSSNEIEAMSLRRLFPARDSSLLVGSVGDRVWVSPSSGSPVKDLFIAGTIKSFPAGMESIRESATVTIEIKFGVSQAPLTVKVSQDRVLNFAVDGGVRPGRGPSRLLAALQMASGRGGPNRLFSTGSDSIHRAFERVAGSLQLGGGPGASAMDQIRQLISRNSALSGPNPTSELRVPGESNQPSGSPTVPSSEPIGSEVQTEDEASTSNTSSPSSKATKHSKTAAPEKNSESSLQSLRPYLKTEDSKPKWTCSQLPKVNLVVGFRKCDVTTASSDRIVVASEFGLDRIDKSNARKDLASRSLFVQLNTSTQRFEAKPGARRALLEVFNSFNDGSTPTGSHRKKRRKLSPTTQQKAKATNTTLWNIEKFTAFMSSVGSPTRYGASTGQSSIGTKSCILFSKFARPNTKRTLLGPDEFIALMVHECKDATKAKQLLKFLRSRGYSEQSLSSSSPRSSGNDEEDEKEEARIVESADNVTTTGNSDKNKLRQPVILRGFSADQNVLKCVEELRQEHRARSNDNSPSLSDLPPWKLTYKLYCDFQVVWPSQSSRDATTTRAVELPTAPLGTMAVLQSRPPSTLLSHGVVTLDRLNGHGMAEASRWLSRIAATQNDRGTRGGFAVPDSVASAVRLLCYLFQSRSNSATLDEALWTSPRLYNKLEAQMQDVLSMCSGIYPPWCDALVTHCKFFFPREVREKLFRATSFGCTRSLHWFRHQLNIDDNGVGSGGDSIPSGAGIYNQEIAISPIPKERVKVRRGNILQSADGVMKMHAKRKAILDVVFVGEKGYGSGVTAAFYSTTAHALQSIKENQKGRLWIPGEDDDAEAAKVTTHHVDGVDADDDAVIRHSNGLFPFPHRTPSTKLADRFRMMGRLAGKALMDERLLPLPLSAQFMKLVVGESFGVEELERVFLSHGRILFTMYKAAKQLSAGKQDVQIEQMTVDDWLDAVGFTFIDPLSLEPLVEGGEDISVTATNLCQFVSAVLELWFDSGIRTQVLAFREGFGEVIPLAKLRLLFVPELLALLCGEDDINWNAESLLKDTKLAHGYTKDSLPVQYFVEVLDEMPSVERREFLLYATGCPNLPPGGFQVLKPPFEVVRRVVDNHDVDRALPFARTCTNTLHLPAYSSKAVLAKQLAFAVANSRGVIDRD